MLRLPLEFFSMRSPDKQTPRKALCPTCRKEAALPAENGFFPFCGERCRWVDLGKWIGEEYRVASAAEEQVFDPESDPSLS